MSRFTSGFPHHPISLPTARTAKLAALLAACALLGASPCIAMPQTSAMPAEQKAAPRSDERTDARRHADGLSRAFRDAAKVLAPSVVTINTTSRKAAPAQSLPPGFRMPAPERQAPARGTGTGVVISRDGYVVTANHVVADAEEIELVLLDGRTASATIVGLDPGTDIAVLRTEASGLAPAGFGNSEALEAGEWVVAIGAPARVSS